AGRARGLDGNGFGLQRDRGRGLGRDARYTARRAPQDQRDRVRAAHGVEGPGLLAGAARQPRHARDTGQSWKRRGQRALQGRNEIAHLRILHLVATELATLTTPWGRRIAGIGRRHAVDRNMGDRAGRSVVTDRRHNGAHMLAAVAAMVLLPAPWFAAHAATTKFFGAVFTSGRMQPNAAMLGVAGDGRLLYLGQGVSLAAEGEITQYVFGHRNTTFSFGLGFQLNDPFGLGHTRLSVYDGPSYALDPPYTSI